MPTFKPQLNIKLDHNSSNFAAWNVTVRAALDFYSCEEALESSCKSKTKISTAFALLFSTIDTQLLLELKPKMIQLTETNPEEYALANGDQQAFETYKSSDVIRSLQNFNRAAILYKAIEVICIHQSHEQVKCIKLEIKNLRIIGTDQKDILVFCNSFLQLLGKFLLAAGRPYSPEDAKDLILDRLPSGNYWDKFKMDHNTSSINTKMTPNELIQLTRNHALLQLSSTNVTPINQTMTKACGRCKRTNHQSYQCRHKDTECKKCGKIGHLAVACRSRPTKRFNNDNQNENNKKYIKLCEQISEMENIINNIISENNDQQ